MTLALAPWESVVHPDGTIERRIAELSGSYTAIDLRAPADVEPGWALVAYDGSAPASHVVASRGGTKPSEIRPNGLFRSKWIASNGGRDRIGDNLGDWIAHRFSTQSDPDGLTDPPLVLPRSRQRFVLFRLGAYSFAVEFQPFIDLDPRVSPALRMLQKKYADKRAVDIDQARKWLQLQVVRFQLVGLQYQKIQGAHVADGPPLQHGTDVADDFSSGSLAGWTQLAGTWAITAGKLKLSSGTHSMIRNDENALGADHYTKADCIDNHAYPGLAVRIHDGATMRGYVGHMTPTATSVKRFDSALSFTSLAVGAHYAVPQTLKLDASGSDLVFSVFEGDTIASVTDSTYSDEYPGLYEYGTAGSHQNFFASNGAAPVSTRSGCGLGGLGVGL